MSKQGILFIAGVLSYLLGSVPFAYILVKIIKKQDIRTLGSGNVGATNATRILGKFWGILVLTLDMSKGFIPVVLIADYLLYQEPSISSHILRVVLGLCAVMGHNWPIFLNFKGGKGVATTFGVLLGLALRIKGLGEVLIGCMFIWLIVLFLSRMVSFASIFTGLSLPLLLFIFKQSGEIILIGIILSTLILLRHIPNIKRILQKKEPRIKI